MGGTPAPRAKIGGRWAGVGTPSFSRPHVQLFTACSASPLKPNRRRQVMELVAGAGAGAITKTSVAPLERYVTSVVRVHG